MRQVILVAGVVAAGLLVSTNGCGPDNENDRPPGDAQRGAVFFAEGDGVSDNPACQSCHCPDATGGCKLSAPNIRGKTYDQIDARTRNENVYHPGGKFQFTNQDIADLEAFLASLVDSN